LFSTLAEYPKKIEKLDDYDNIEAFMLMSIEKSILMELDNDIIMMNWVLKVIF